VSNDEPPEFLDPSLNGMDPEKFVFDVTGMISNFQGRGISTFYFTGVMEEKIIDWVPLISYFGFVLCGPTHGTWEKS
jgi:hypothetical protein